MKKCTIDPFVLTDIRFQRCYWGDQCGVKLPANSKSVRRYKYDTDSATPQEQKIVRWSVSTEESICRISSTPEGLIKHQRIILKTRRQNFREIVAN